MSDHFTKWVEAKAISNQETATIVQVLMDELFTRHGFPRKILTDRRRNFRSVMLQELMKQLEIKGMMTTSYNPHTNGLEERFNRTLVDMMSMFIWKNQKDWNEHLPYVLFAY